MCAAQAACFTDGLFCGGADGAVGLDVAFPKLTHGNVVDTFALQGVDPLGEEWAAGLGMGAAKAALDAPLAQPAVVVRGDQIGRRAPVVGQKSPRDLRILHGLAEQRRQVEERIVAAPLAKLLAHLRRPRRLAQFPTVDVEILERLAHQRAGVGDQLGPGGGEMGVHRRGVIVSISSPPGPEPTHFTMLPCSV